MSSFGKKPMSSFGKILIANRGEIAVRIIRACRELGITSVAVFSEVDRAALHVQMADEAVPIGPANSTESYLSIERVLEAARLSGAQAIHPGYGFLSENAGFARACEEAGIKFIGPDWRAIERMGSKTAARELAVSVGAPVVPGSGALTGADEACRTAAAIGYPVLLKAAAGGGGKGMRRVDQEADLVTAMRLAASEAERAFGSGEIYLEKFIERPRHIEIQVIGDEQGHLIHLGERECSIQRRHQKIVEESPSPLVLAHPELRDKVGEAALRIARAAQYSNAGTLEFLADQSGNFYFLEMNTRLQVEHPVTEWVTGIDLVELQIRIAAGERLSLEQEEICWNGSAIECRIYAEDPENNFFPSAGRISQYTEPAGPGVRVDGGVYAGWTVPIEYDPLLAKLSVWAKTRAAATDRMRRAISEYRILGLTTNLGLFEHLMNDQKWKKGDLDTGFLENFFGRRTKDEPDQECRIAAILAATEVRQPQPHDARANGFSSRWRAAGLQALLR
jgi:acetyl-CoA carboxylase, biotin carboxylase subunit